MSHAEVWPIAPTSLPHFPLSISLVFIRFSAIKPNFRQNNVRIAFVPSEFVGLHAEALQCIYTEEINSLCFKFDFLLHGVTAKRR